MRFRLMLLLVIGLGSCSHPSDPDKPHVIIETQMGDIEVELYPKQAPKTVGAFLSYVDSGFYKDGSFYRVLNDDNQPSGSGGVKLIQGGIFVTNHAKEVTIPGIPHETTQQTHILHKDGTISMARTTPGTASTEFFICIGNQPGFDYGGENNPDGQGMAAFGHVVKGMDVVNQIYSQPSSGTSIAPTVRIKGIERN